MCDSGASFIAPSVFLSLPQCSQGCAAGTRPGGSPLAKGRLLLLAHFWPGRRAAAPRAAAPSQQTVAGVEVFQWGWGTRSARPLPVCTVLGAQRWSKVLANTCRTPPLAPRFWPRPFCQEGGSSNLSAQLQYPLRRARACVRVSNGGGAPCPCRAAALFARPRVFKVTARSWCNKGSCSGVVWCQGPAQCFWCARPSERRPAARSPPDPWAAYAAARV